MTHLYLGVGHGVQPNGVFDPGAVAPAPDNTHEYDLNFPVTNSAHMALARSGVNHYTETDAGRGHDVDYRGAVDAINAGGYDLAVEIHFDTNAASEGEFGIYASEEGKRLADLITARAGSVGITTKPNYKDVRGLYFIEGTNCPAVIIECGPTKSYDAEGLRLVGEIIAAGICDWYAVPYTPQSAAQPVGPSHDTLPQTDLAVAVALTGQGKARWVALSDGGVFAFDGAPFYGSMGSHPMNAPVVDIIGVGSDGYYLIGADGGVFAFGVVPAHPAYAGLFAEYAAGQRKIVGASLAAGGLHLVSNHAEDYGL